jgi:nucleoside-diphosphate-sugar epimerase
MRVLVVGGTGFLGYHAVLELRRRGHEVAVLALPPLPAGLLPPEVKVTLANLNQMDDSAVWQMLSGVDAVVYAAGVDERTVPPEPAREFFLRGNVAPTERVFRLAREAGVTRGVVLGSYFAHFDRIWPELKLSEKHPYIHSRQEQVRRAFETAGKKLKLCVLELPYIFGSMPGTVPLWEPLIAYVRAPVPLVCTRGGTNMVSVKQVAEAIAGALERGKGGRCYQIGDENHTWVEILQMLGAIVGRDNNEVTVLPDSVFREASRIDAFYMAMLGKEPGMDAVELVELMTTETYFDPEPSRRQLGYGRGGLQEALKETVAACPMHPTLWFLKQYWKQFYESLKIGG